MNILVVHFSYQSTVEMAAESIAARLTASGHSVETARIEPVKPRGYWSWLLLSFIPGTRVRIQPVRADLQSFDRICIGFPKWTFSCPPINEYLATATIPRSLPVGLFMVYGGWDQDRYLRTMVRRVSRSNPVVASLALKRRRVLAGEHGNAVSEFCRGMSGEFRGHNT